MVVHQQIYQSWEIRVVRFAMAPTVIWSMVQHRMHSSPCKPPYGYASNVISMSVYLSVCFSARISPVRHVWSLPNFVDVAWMFPGSGQDLSNSVATLLYDIQKSQITAELIHTIKINRFLANVNVYVTFAICYRRSVCRLSVVCNVGAPYSAGWNFRQFFFAIR